MTSTSESLVIVDNDGDDAAVGVLGSEAISQNMIRPKAKAVTTTMCFSVMAFTFCLPLYKVLRRKAYRASATV
jgi:hypothetical protein